MNITKSLLACCLGLLWLVVSPVSAAPIPTVDLSEDAARQVVIAQGTEQIYQGHPTTLLLPDGHTMYAVWTLGHGGACGPMKRSDDGGKTWSELWPTPENWTGTRNCPALYRLTDPQGVTRLFVFAGQGADGRMSQARSEDEGRTWTPMTGNGLRCIMPFCTIVPVDGGKKLVGLTNIRRSNEAQDKSSNIIAQSESTDGGLTWAPWRIILDLGEIKPCEPEIVRSPDGRQLLCLLRENSRKIGGLFMTSDDEGRTWSAAKPLPPALHGDRHKAHYAPDGRLVICFRDTGKENPTRNHFVAWVGKYADIVGGLDGQYRIKLLHSYAGSDCGYPGLELLPDGTFVATTYVKYRPGPEKQSVVSTRFQLAETDRAAAGSPKQKAADNAKVSEKRDVAPPATRPGAAAPGHAPKEGNEQELSHEVAVAWAIGLNNLRAGRLDTRDVARYVNGQNSGESGRVHANFSGGLMLKDGFTEEFVDRVFKALGPSKSRALLRGEVCPAFYTVLSQ